jgi:hypothetical protein
MTNRIQSLLCVTLAFSFWINVSAQEISKESLGRPGPYQVAYYSSYPPVPDFSAAKTSQALPYHPASSNLRKI